MPSSIRLARRRSLVWIATIVIAGGCAMLSPAERIAALMREAQELSAAKRYDEALDRYTQVIRLDEAHWQAHVGMARAFIGKGDWPRAVASAREAYRFAPNAVEATTALAEALLGAGLQALDARRYAEAITHLLECLKLRPDAIAAYLGLGRAYLGERRYGPALEAFVKGLGVAGRDARAERGALVRALFDGGTQALSQNDFRSAIGFLREYVKLDSGNVQAYLNLAKAQWNAGERIEALNGFRKVLELSPTNAEALRYLMR